MARDRPPMLSQKLEFFGAVSASISHELKNVLATIDGFSGLLEDLTLAAASGRPLAPERLEKLGGRIKRQADRGAELVVRLNRFAHSVDEPWAAVDVGEVLGRICDICERFASLGKVTLERSGVDEGALWVELDAFAFQHVLFLAIRAALDAAGGERVVRVGLRGLGRGYEVTITSADPLGGAGRAVVDSELVRGLASELGGDVSLEGDTMVLRVDPDLAHPD